MMVLSLFLVHKFASVTSVGSLYCCFKPGHSDNAREATNLSTYSSGIVSLLGLVWFVRGRGVCISDHTHKYKTMASIIRVPR